MPGSTSFADFIAFCLERGILASMRNMPFRTWWLPHVTISGLGAVAIWLCNGEMISPQTNSFIILCPRSNVTNTNREVMFATKRADHTYGNKSTAWLVYRKPCHSKTRTHPHKSLCQDFRGASTPQRVDTVDPQHLIKTPPPGRLNSLYSLDHGITLLFISALPIDHLHIVKTLWD